MRKSLFQSKTIVEIKDFVPEESYYTNNEGTKIYGKKVSQELHQKIQEQVKKYINLKITKENLISTKSLSNVIDNLYIKNEKGEYFRKVYEKNGKFELYLSYLFINPCIFRKERINFPDRQKENLVANTITVEEFIDAVNTLKKINKNKDCIVEMVFQDNINQKIECLKPKIFNEQEQKCECPEEFEEINGLCVCPEGMIEKDGKCVNICKTEEHEIYVNGDCVCDTNNDYVLIKGKCGKCPSNKNYDPDNEDCVCKDGTNPTKDGSCIKCNEDQTFNKDTEECECPEGMIEKDGKCVNICKTEEHEIYVNGDCVCDTINDYVLIKGKCGKCPSDKKYDPDNEDCVCKDGTHEKQDGSCIKCEEGKEFNHSKDKCECPEGTIEAEGECIKCRPDLNEMLNENKECVCKPGYEKFKEECLPICTEPKIRNKDIGLCECPKGFIETKEGCVKKIPECQEKNKIYNEITFKCECKKPWIEDQETNECICPSISKKEYDEITDPIFKKECSYTQCPEEAEEFKSDEGKIECCFLPKIVIDNKCQCPEDMQLNDKGDCDCKEIDETYDINKQKCVKVQVIQKDVNVVGDSGYELHIKRGNGYSKYGLSLIEFHKNGKDTGDKFEYNSQRDKLDETAKNNEFVCNIYAELKDLYITRIPNLPYFIRQRDRSICFDLTDKKGRILSMKSAKALPGQAIHFYSKSRVPPFKTSPIQATLYAHIPFDKDEMNAQKNLLTSIGSKLGKYYGYMTKLNNIRNSNVNSGIKIVNEKIETVNENQETDEARHLSLRNEINRLIKKNFPPYKNDPKKESLRKNKIKNFWKSESELINKNIDLDYYYKTLKSLLEKRIDLESVIKQMGKINFKIM